MVESVNGDSVAAVKRRRSRAAVELTPLALEVFTRDTGRRERTRAILLDATAKLLATRDPGELSICDITDAAGVANGTFYYHFSSKPEIVGETAFHIARHLSTRIYKAGTDIADPVERIATAARRFVRFCFEHPTWAYALGRSVNYLPTTRKQVYRTMSWTIRRGIKQGDFQAEDIDLTYDTLMSIAFTGARASMEGMDPEEAGSATSEMQLRVLGVPLDRAKRASRLDLEPWS